MTQDWSHLGSVIRQHRRRARMSQDDLAHASGLSKRTIGNYERGRVPESAPIVPDGYHDIARVIGWTPASVDAVLAGGEPTLTAEAGRAEEREMGELIGPVFQLADLARDAGAPADLVSRFRLAAVELVASLSSRQRSDVGRTLGEGVSPADAERLLGGIEGDDM